MASLSRIRVHPIKSLDPVERDSVEVSSVGGLAGDRSHAIVDADGEYVNGKRTADVHRLRSRVDPDAGVVEIGVRGGPETRQFELDGERNGLETWLSEYFDYEVSIEAAHGGELADSRVYGGGTGATITSTETLREVASWFPDLDVEDVRRRFRANLEVEGVEAFWEDRFVGRGGASTGGPRVTIGEVAFEGVKPITRCVVPTRDPDTGATTDGFRERFVERREETFPDWADRDAFEHFYALTTLVHPDEADWGGSIRRGDEIELLD